MKWQHLGLFRCPHCGGALQNESRLLGEEDPLTCVSCDRSYPLLAGVPRLLLEPAAEDLTSRAFGLQWMSQHHGAFEKDTIYGETSEQEIQSFLDRFGITHPFMLGSRRILDIGCGSGRLTRSLGAYAPKAIIVGGDRSAAIFVAQERCRDLPNVVVAQMDLYAAPFPSGSFDLVYADGVLPHVPDPIAALRCLYNLVRPGGKMFVWVYPRQFSPYRFVRDILLRPYRFPRALQRGLCWFLGIPLFIGFKLWEPLHGPRRRSLREVVFMLNDNLTPEFQHRFTAQQLSREFEKLGCVEVGLLDPPVGVVGTKPGDFVQSDRDSVTS